MAAEISTLDRILWELFHGLEVLTGLFKEPCSSVAALLGIQGAAVTDENDVPVLDSGALQSLADEAGPATAHTFMDEYLQMLPVRAAKILRGLAGHDADSAAEALVSLRATSAMAGALRLEAYCRDLERALNRGHWPDPKAAKAVLFANIRLLVREANRQGHLPGPRPKGPEAG